MTLETDLATAIDSLVSSRFYPDTAPLNTTKPYATYQQVGGQALNPINGTPPDYRHARVQINVWHSTRAAANTLMGQIEDAIRGTPLFGAAEGALIAKYESVTKSYGAIQDFSFWHS